MEDRREPVDEPVPTTTPLNTSPAPLRAGGCLPARAGVWGQRPRKGVLSEQDWADLDKWSGDHEVRSKLGIVCWGANSRSNSKSAIVRQLIQNFRRDLRESDVIIPEK